MFWLVLILRIAKNYVFNSALGDERSDDEGDDEEEDLSQKQLKGELEDRNGSPVLLTNGQSVDHMNGNAEPVARAANVKERKKRKA